MTPNYPYVLDSDGLDLIAVFPGYDVILCGTVVCVHYSDNDEDFYTVRVRRGEFVWRKHHGFDILTGATPPDEVRQFCETYITLTR
jgi:hypothetical protein